MWQNLGVKYKVESVLYDKLKKAWIPKKEWKIVYDEGG